MPAPRLHRRPSPSIPGISDSVRVSVGDLVFISGAVGMGPGGTAAPTFEAEIDLCFAEVSRALTSAGCTLSDIVKITVFIVGLTPERVATFRAVRDRWVDPDEVPASTLLGVSALFSDAVSIEIEAVAAG